MGTPAASPHARPKRGKSLFGPLDERETAEPVERLAGVVLRDVRALAFMHPLGANRAYEFIS
jgi:hypothetical protein